MCVLYILKCCVLVGLDWAESVMLLSLHVICSCIFHSYVPLLIFFRYWYVFCTFLHASLSLSLSLSLVSCSMAPKWKSASSRNPLRFGASSSNFTPSHVRFRFGEIFSTGHWFGTSSHSIRLFQYWPSTVIYSRGWESLCGIPVTCPSMII